MAQFEIECSRGLSGHQIACHYQKNHRCQPTEAENAKPMLEARLDCGGPHFVTMGESIGRRIAMLNLRNMFSIASPPSVSENSDRHSDQELVKAKAGAFIETARRIQPGSDKPDHFRRASKFGMAART